MTGRSGVTARAIAPAARVDAWLAELGLDPIARGERDGVVSRDLLLHGRRRRGIRLTLILDPGLACVLWVHFAPPLSDGFRRSYRQLLRWNDELPFAKFALGADERIVLTSELPAALDREALGLGIARLVAICDLLYEESSSWLTTGRRRPGSPGTDAEVPDTGPRSPAPSSVLIRYEAALGELGEPG